jgi:hypothetical protein
MSEPEYNELKILLLLNDDEIKELEEKAISLGLNLNIRLEIINCNYVKSCVIKQINKLIKVQEDTIIAVEDIRNFLNKEQEKNKPRRDKNH